jgi:hypothetical protein
MLQGYGLLGALLSLLQLVGELLGGLTVLVLEALELGVAAVEGLAELFGLEEENLEFFLYQMELFEVEAGFIPSSPQLLLGAVELLAGFGLTQGPGGDPGDRTRVHGEEFRPASSHSP